MGAFGQKDCLHTCRRWFPTSLLPARHALRGSEKVIADCVIDDSRTALLTYFGNGRSLGAQVLNGTMTTASVLSANHGSDDGFK